MAANSLLVKVLRNIASRPEDKDYNRYKERAQFYLYRVPEELYDTEQDPGCMHNLIDDPDHRQVRDAFRSEMESLLKGTMDHELENYQKFILR
jgi:hypothetical protein